MDFLRRRLPTRDQLARNRWLGWIGPSLLHPRLWHFSRRGVAIGVALGVFFGLLIPIAQIPVAAGVAVLLRANLPAAVGSTLVTNPVTFAPIYVLAHKLGSTLLAEEATSPPTVEEAPPQAGWWEKVSLRVLALGKPLLLGLVILSVSAGILVYAIIMLGWRLRTAWAWRKRRVKAGHGA